MAFRDVSLPRPRPQLSGVIRPRRGDAVDGPEVMNRCDAEAERVGLAQRTAAGRVVVPVSRASSETGPGGLDSFSYRPAGGEAVPAEAP